MGKHWNEKELDAYGHLNWTVGNEDWIACFDAIRVAGGIHYHVVVNCESGGFIDTLEDGTVPLADAAEELCNLPLFWASIAREHYPNGRGRFFISVRETRKCNKSWNAHVKELCALPEPDPGEEDADEMGELRRAALSRGQP